MIIDLNNGSNTTVQAQRHGPNSNSDSYIANHKSNTKIIHDTRDWPDHMRPTSLKLCISFFFFCFVFLFMLLVVVTTISNINVNHTNNNNDNNHDR